MSPLITNAAPLATDYPLPTTSTIPSSNIPPPSTPHGERGLQGERGPPGSDGERGPPGPGPGPAGPLGHQDGGVLARSSPSQVLGYAGVVLAAAVGVFCAGFFPDLLGEKNESGGNPHRHLGVAAQGLLRFAALLVISSAGVAASAGANPSARVSWANLFVHIGGCCAVSAALVVGWTFKTDHAFAAWFGVVAVIAGLFQLWSREE